MKRGLLLGLLALVAIVAGASIRSFWPGKLMTPTEVGMRWGKAALDKSKFKNATESERAKMAFSILDLKKEFVGLDSADVRKELGDFDGYYFRDSIPTYVIHVGTDDGEDSWQLVFLIDDKFKVADIVVHKM